MARLTRFDELFGEDAYENSPYLMNVSPGLVGPDRSDLNKRRERVTARSFRSQRRGNRGYVSGQDPESTAGERWIPLPPPSIAPSITPSQTPIQDDNMYTAPAPMEDPNEPMAPGELERIMAPTLRGYDSGDVFTNTRDYTREGGEDRSRTRDYSSEAGVSPRDTYNDYYGRSNGGSGWGEDEAASYRTQAQSTDYQRRMGTEFALSAINPRAMIEGYQGYGLEGLAQTTFGPAASTMGLTNLANSIGGVAYNEKQTQDAMKNVFGEEYDPNTATPDQQAYEEVARRTDTPIFGGLGGFIEDTISSLSGNKTIEEEKAIAMSKAMTAAGVPIPGIDLDEMEEEENVPTSSKPMGQIIDTRSLDWASGNWSLNPKTNTITNRVTGQTIDATTGEVLSGSGSAEGGEGVNKQKALTNYNAIQSDWLGISRDIYGGGEGSGYGGSGGTGRSHEASGGFGSGPGY